MSNFSYCENFSSNRKSTKKLREKNIKFQIYVIFSFPNIGGIEAVNSKILLNNKNYDIFIYALYTY